MPAVIEVKYFNSFFLNKTNVSDEPIWNGSRGIPADIGGYPSVANTLDTDNWIVEESRIRGGYNNTSTDYGARAYLVEENKNASFRFNSMIYSGIFNSRTGINNSNIFSVAEDITKSVNPVKGSIQKLYAENSNLIIFQEEKVSRALIDKDAIYSAEGGGTAVSSFTTVIGQIVPYLGEYGISKNPESFAVYGYDKYFSDKNNNAILRLTNNGIVEISAYGMKDFFRDELNSIDTASSSGIVLGGYNVYSSEYTVSLQKNPVTQANQPSSTTSFDANVNGWPTFFTYKPEQMFSIQNKFYTVNSGGLYQHYAATTASGSAVNRNTFYGVQEPSSITFIVNDSPASSKTFQAIGYEGSSGWQVNRFTSDFTGEIVDPNGASWIKTFDITTPPPPLTGPAVKSYYEGEYVIVNTTALTTEASTGTTVTIGSLTGTPPIGATVSGNGVTNGTVVVSYVPGTGILTVDQNLNVAEFETLGFSLVVDRSGYNAAFGTTNPAFPKYYAGFTIKENKYVANLINTSSANEKEIIFGQSISGIKGFYSSVTLATDATTSPGGEKQLFNVTTVYTSNNGY
tara:strand:- start:118 stop:1830 length:1713 start_codon:yes stop_codon:yes gene_type:complete